jgi:AcrR family transcriptional regulator
VSSATIGRIRRGLTSDQRRTAILDAAAVVFDRAGYSGATLEDVAREAGIGKTTLYHYFDSKAEILFGIHEVFIDLLISSHERRLRLGLGPDQLLLEVLADILELMDTHRGHVRVFFEHHRELPEPDREVIRVKRDRYEAMLQDVIRGGIADGSFRQVDPSLSALALFGMCNWAYQWYRPDGELRTREIAYRFYDFFVNGIGAPGLRGPVPPPPAP